MPNEVVCLVRHNGRVAEGKAKRESHELVFRSPELRLRIPFARGLQVAVEGEELTLRWPEGETRFEIGAAEATRWSKAIANPPSLLDKLGVKAGQRVCVIGVDGALRGEVRARGAELHDDPTGADLVFYGVARPDELDRLADLRARIKPNGAVWVVSPKGRTGLREADVYAAGKAAGLVDVKVAAFSASHTANKFVIPLADRPRA